MVLVDTSVWIDHLHRGDKVRVALLEGGEVLQHPLIVGELACWGIKNRSVVLGLIKALPEAVKAEHEEVLGFIESNALSGRGLGCVNVQLLASAILSGVEQWSKDKALRNAADQLKIRFAE